MVPGAVSLNNRKLCRNISHWKPVVRPVKIKIGVWLTLTTRLEPVCLFEPYGLVLLASQILSTSSQLDGITPKSNGGGRITRVKHRLG
jgi:hypothetical protein